MLLKKIKLEIMCCFPISMNLRSIGYTNKSHGSFYSDACIHLIDRQSVDNVSCNLITVRKIHIINLVYATLYNWVWYFRGGGPVMWVWGNTACR